MEGKCPGQFQNVRVIKLKGMMALISPLQKQVGVFKGGFFGEDSRIVQI